MFGLDKPIVPRGSRCLLIAAALLLLSTGFALAAPAGTVVGLGGACVVESGGARSALKLGQSVEVGDTVDIPADGKLKLRMADGSVIALAAGTRMTIVAYAADGARQRQDALLSLTHGLLRAVVAPVDRPARFEVDTAVGSAAVRSTDWFVEASETDMQVRVISGSVALTSAATQRTQTIPARWGSHLAAGHDPTPPRALRRSDLDALIGRTRVARGENRDQGPVRAHAARSNRGREGEHRLGGGARPSGHKANEDRRGLEIQHQHPETHEPEHISPRRGK
jgi:hypothetical protein